MIGSFWRGRKVLVTGHTGFKGGWLTVWLKHLGAEVAGYSLPAEQPSLFEQAQVERGVDSITGDIRSLPAVAEAMQSFEPEIVFHMAAQALVRPSYEDPVTTFDTNVIGTINVFEAVRRVRSVTAVVNVTSDKCYENREWPWGYRETDRLGGFDPYSASKACAELVTAAYRCSFFEKANIAVASARAGNVIGGGDWARDRLVPDLIRGFMKNRPAIVRYADSVRPWQHVCEPLHGYLLLAENLCNRIQGSTEAWNFGPPEDSAIPVSRIADYLSSAWGEGATWAPSCERHAHEAGYLKLDSSKSRARLGWRSRLNLTTALDWTVNWYRAAQDRTADMRQVTEAQISEYSSLCSCD